MDTHSDRFVSGVFCLFTLSDEEQYSTSIGKAQSNR